MWSSLFFLRNVSAAVRIDFCDERSAMRRSSFAPGTSLLISSIVALPFSWLRTRSVTCAPHFAKPTAVAFPMPDVAPVTSATVSLGERMGDASSDPVFGEGGRLVPRRAWQRLGDLLGQ